MKTFVLSLLIMFGAVSHASAADALSVTPQAVWNLVQEDADNILFIDIRDPVEIMFVGFTDTIDINIPFKLVDRTQFNEDKAIFTMYSNPDFVSDIEKALKAKGLGKDALIVTMCRSGSERGKPSADYLLTQGFTNVKYVDHGFQGSAVKEGAMKGFRTMNGWQNAKLPWSSTINPSKINKP
ncbi:rhodanese-like domain-containing protein [Psychrobacter sp. CAL346-MNA-CIBAN-0220]|uniref:rhodanese-like domain-containing protein n=1 Tax=Psychrobacter sp. CAL346-MNA-CIBAN-0220 TaxID=3140457 RepID=UPI00332EFF12